MAVPLRNCARLMPVADGGGAAALRMIDDCVTAALLLLPSAGAHGVMMMNDEG